MINGWKVIKRPTHAHLIFWKKKDQLILPSGTSKGSLPVQTPYILKKKIDKYCQTMGSVAVQHDSAYCQAM